MLQHKHKNSVPKAEQEEPHITLPEDGHEPIEFDPSGQEDVAVPQGGTPEETKQPEDQEPERIDTFPIVGLGASAGGLDAFERFFKAMPPDCGMAFVIVQHLDPTHKSILSELIQKYTRMEVHEVEDGMPVQADNVYVIPPNCDMALVRGRLHLLEQSRVRGQRLPIDFFFRSLASDWGDRAVGIVLSGTGTEGTLGLKAIKERDGMVMIQSLESAQYDGMPRSAIATGLADFILPPEKMPAQLIAYERRVPSTHTVRRYLQQPRPASSDLHKVLILLRAKSGHDFFGYKQNTIIRRIERRMSINQVEDMADYVRILADNPQEVETLFRELLIEVTNFFRDPDAFALLREKVVPELFHNRPPDIPIRIWVAGCSTGEEAYSLAMVMRDYMDEHHLDHRVQIFATDIDKNAIEVARQGAYPDSITADIPSETYLRFFNKTGNAYQVKKPVRDMIVFAVQSVIKDPPFSKIDLLTCRNLLIYMGSDLQKRVLRLFHYALNPGGYLFLGSSESIGEFTELFQALDRKWKVYQRKTGTFQGPAGNLATTMPAVENWMAGRDVKPREKISLREVAEKTLLNSYSPSAAIVDEKGDVLYIHGRTGKYLEPASGEANMNIISMAREGLRLELSSAIRRAVAQRQEIFCPGLRVKTNGDTQTVDVAVRPLTDPFVALHGLLFVTIQDRPTPPPPEEGEEGGQMPAEAYHRITELEQELQSAREYLRSTIEELETSNEELKSANEELQSSNEEMQSTNEELETSKEELQSVNEELITVNAELETNLEELSRTNSDLNNLLVSTDIGTIFLDEALHVERFTPAATRFVNLIPGDIGRPISHLVLNIERNTLVEDVQSVLDTLRTQEREARTTDGRWCLIRILPYRTVENVVRGAVVSFIDISEQKRVQEQLLALTRAIEHTGSIVVITDLQGNIEYVNPRFTVVTGYTSDEVLGRNPRFLRSEEHPEEFYDHMWNTLQAGQEWRGRFHNRKKNGELWWESVNVSPVKSPDGTVTQYLSVGEDVTSHGQMDVLRGVAAHLTTQLHDTDDPVTVLDFDGRILAWNRAAAQTYGWHAQNAQGLSIRNWIPEGLRERFMQSLLKLHNAPEVEPLELRRRQMDGHETEVMMNFTRLQDDAGEPFAISLTEKRISKEES